MFCQGCGMQVPEGGRFCAGCGKSVEAAAAAPVKAYGLLRGLNWALAGLLMVSIVTWVIKAETLSAIALIASFALVFVGFPVLSAVAMGPACLSMAGIFVPFNAVVHKRIRAVALGFNVLMALFGIGGAIACVASSQWGPMAGMLIYVLLPGANLRAIMQLRKSAP